MKKLYVILAVVLTAMVMSSCDTTEGTISLALNNDVVDLPKSLVDKALVHYAQVTSNGTWEATLETEDGTSWCWLETSYTNSKGETIAIKGLTPIAYDDGGLVRKVKGTGTIFVPIVYSPTSATKYAVFTVYRPDTGERCSMRLDQ